MTEHCAVYQVESGMPDDTFLFFYPRGSLTEMDESGPQHGAAAYRDDEPHASALTPEEPMDRGGGSGFSDAFVQVDALPDRAGARP